MKKDLVGLWWEVEEEVITYQKKYGQVDGLSSTVVVERTFEHWLMGREPKWNKKTDIRSYLFGIARQIMDKKQ